MIIINEFDKQKPRDGALCFVQGRSGRFYIVRSYDPKFLGSFYEEPWSNVKLMIMGDDVPIRWCYVEDVFKEELKFSDISLEEDEMKF